MILDSGIFMEEGTTIHNYRLRMWVDESAEIPNGESRKYGVKVNVYAKQVSSENFTDESCFTFDKTTGTITDYDINCPKDVVIPYTIDGVKVTTIGNAAFQSKALTNLSLPNTITSIGSKAFYNNKITNLSISKSVTNIGIGAFIKNQMSDEDAFIYNRNSDGSIDYTSLNSYAGAKKDDVIIPNNVTYIGEDAFATNQLASVTIPNSVTIIGRKAFRNNQLTSIEIPNSVTSIGVSAFSTNQLTSIVLLDGLIDIGGSAFLDNQLTSVIIPKTVNKIQTSAFGKNNTLTKFVNQTGKEFRWKEILDVNSANNFTCITCTFEFGSRTVEITSS